MNNKDPNLIFVFVFIIVIIASACFIGYLYDKLIKPYLKVFIPTLNKIKKIYDETIVPFWGMIFRFLFYTALGFFGYSKLKEKNICNIPLGSLTLSDIISKTIGIILIALSVYLFFNIFEADSKTRRENYKVWASLSILIMAGGILFLIYIYQ